MKRIAIATLVFILLVGTGLLTQYEGAPDKIVWPTVGTLVFLIVGFIFRARRIRPETKKDGRDYRVEVDDEKCTVTNLETGKRSILAWQDLTGVHINVVAMPSGSGMSYVLYRNQKTLEIPLGAQGNEVLLAKMQEKLADFDNEALIEGMAMTQGRVQVWPKRTSGLEDNTS